MENEIDDIKLAKISLAKKVTALCIQFMRANGVENIDLEIITQEPVLTTGFDNGKTVCGKTLSVKVDTWDDEDDDN